MDVLNSVGLLFGSAWTSGVNLYLTVAVLGIADKFGWLTLPGNLDAISNPFVIFVAIVLYTIEFVADKIPFVDSAWDTIHTFIRPFGGALLGFFALAPAGAPAQIIVALLTGSVALSSHLTKATTRLAINTSPEPVTNSVASVTEDALVVGVMYLIIRHPIIAILVITLLLAASIWLLMKLFKFIKKIFTFNKGDAKTA